MSAVISNEAQICGLATGQGDWESDDWPSLNQTLEPLDGVRVHQHLDVMEVCLGWERNNRYSVYNKQGEQILYVYEAAQCYTRQCLGSLRQFKLTITDNNDNKLLYLHRPLRCSTRCCYVCCCLQKLYILTPPDVLLAEATEKWTCCCPEYELQTATGNITFQVEGDCCHFRCCCSIHFVVKNSFGCQIAAVTKEHGGCKELIGAYNDFSIEYMDSLSDSEKVIIFAAAFLLDFNYFERHGKCF